MELSTGAKGTVSELKACIWLIENGYDVFRNVSAFGKFDILALKDDDLLKIDVTTAGIGFSRGKQEKAKLNGGRVVYVLPDGSCKYDIDYDPTYNKNQFNCTICGIEFESYKKHRTTCGSDKCKVERGKINNKKRKLL